MITHATMLLLSKYYFNAYHNNWIKGNTENMPYVKFWNVDSDNSELACISQHCSLFFSVEITPTNLSLHWELTA